MNERRMGSSRAHREGIKKTLDGIEQDDRQAIAETEAAPMRGVVDMKEMRIREIAGTDTETWLRGYDANGLSELEEDPELMVSEAEKLGVDSERLIELVLAESTKRVDAFKEELDAMSEDELGRRYIDSVNGEGPETDYAFAFSTVNISEYDKLIRQRADEIGKVDEWWEAA